MEEPHNRNRKPTSIAGALQRLIVLDAVLSNTDPVWLATEREEVAHFTKLLGTAFRRDGPASPRKHRITLMQVQRWLDGSTTSPHEAVKRRHLKELLAAP
jgi:hypothetical protein